MAVPKKIGDLEFLGAEMNKPDGSDESAHFATADGAISVSLHVYRGPADLKGPFLALNAKGERIAEDNKDVVAKYHGVWKLTEPSKSYLDEFERAIGNVRKAGRLKDVQETSRGRRLAVPQRSDTPVAYIVMLKGIQNGEGAPAIPLNWCIYLFAVNGYFVKLYCTTPADLDVSRWGAETKVVQAINWDKLLPPLAPAGL